MGNSLKLFTIRGIELKLHITFPLILLWAALQFGLLAGNLSSALFGVVAVSFLFVLVTLHELGHSFAAQYYGVPVKQIVLSPLGGVAQLAHIPEKPSQEFVIAIAGPAVNFIIAILMGLLALGSGISFSHLLASSPLAGLSISSGFSLQALFSYIFFYNILLALFNLLPAFPLDGGRIFRSLLAMRLPYVQATNIASTVGRALAIALGLYGLFNGGFFLVLIAVFIYVGAGQEAAQVRMRGVLRGYTVEQVYDSSAHRLSPDSTVRQASDLMIFGGQKSFPVLEGETLVGFLPHEELLAAMRTAVSYARIGAFMRRDIRPVSCEDDLYDVQQRLFAEKASALPVVSDGRFMGLITLRHIGELYRMLRVTPKAWPQSQSA
jgi:Zn-dependent protease/CBS domain-containing protein